MGETIGNKWVPMSNYKCITWEGDWEGGLIIYIYIYMCVCVCVCVEREREREREREIF